MPKTEASENGLRVDFTANEVCAILTAAAARYIGRPIDASRCTFLDVDGSRFAVPTAIKSMRVLALGANQET